MSKEKRKSGSIILQVAVLFGIGVLISGMIMLLSQHKRADSTVREQAETLSEELSTEIGFAVREYPAYEWLLNYWYENSDRLDIEYDAELSAETRTAEKYHEFKDRNPDVQMKYVGEDTIRALPEEDQKLYAEIAYSWLITRINNIKQTHKIDYLFCVLTSEPYDTQFFLFSAADPGAVRGTNYEEVYPLGHVVQVGQSQQEAMRSACQNTNHLAEAGAYVDYYSYLCSVGGNEVLIGLTYSLAALRENIDSLTWMSTAYAMSYQIILSAICLLLIFFFVLLPLRMVQQNIRLYHQTKDSAEVIKNLSEVRSRNEIGELSEDVMELTREIDDYTGRIAEITADRERIATELSLATRIQAAFIPHCFPPFPDRAEFDIYASMVPAKEVGGDFYDFFLIDEDHLCMVMADVSGKGIPAALFMMVSKIILQSCAMLGQSPADILTKTNEAICSNNQEGMFVTVWLGILEISTGKLTAANAGHEYPALKKPDGRFELLKGKHGFVIGGIGGVKYKNYELTLEPGTKLFLYTDGVPEATDSDRAMFGSERMIAALNEEPEAAPQQLLEKVKSAVDGFVRDAEQFDDLTMLCLEYRGGMGNGS